jgi:hypothetical protein
LRCDQNTLIRNLRLTAAALLAMLAAVSSSIHAQTFSPVRTTQTEQPTPGWVFTPRVSFGGSWDDNVFLVHPADNPPGDYASPIGPAATLDYSGKRTRFSAGYDGSIVLYRSLDELTSYSQFLSAAFEHRASERLTIKLHETFNMAPTTDAIPSVGGGVPFYRIGSRANAAGGGFVAALQKHLTVGGSYTLRIVDFDFDEQLGRELRGGTSHELDFSVDRALSPRLSVGGEYSFDRVSHEAGTALEGPDERFNIQSGSVTATYQLRPTVTVTGAFGLAHMGSGLTFEGRTAPAWRAGITHTRRDVALSALYSRSFIPSFGFGGTLQNEEWSGRVFVPFARNRAYTEGSLSWFNNESLEPDQPKLRTVWVSGKLGYRVTRWLSVEGFYNRSGQDSHRPGGQLSRNQIGFQVVTFKPLRIY